MRPVLNPDGTKKLVIDDLTGKPCGVHLAFGDSEGPCIYGVLPLKPKPGDFWSNMFAFISARESVRGNPKDVSLAKLPLEPCLDLVQAYEAHGVSLGGVNWISKYGLAQTLMRRIAREIPEIGAWVNTRGYFLGQDKDPFLVEGYVGQEPEHEDGEEVFTPLPLEYVRSDHFAVTMWRALAGMIASRDDDGNLLPHFAPPDLRGVQEHIQQIQTAFFRETVMERWPVVSDTGWEGATRGDEQVAGAICTLAINAGRGVMREILSYARAKTLANLIASWKRTYTQIGMKKGLGADFGHERADWVAKTTHLNIDGYTYEVIRPGKAAAIG